MMKKLFYLLCMMLLCVSCSDNNESNGDSRLDDYAFSVTIDGEVNYGGEQLPRSVEVGRYLLEVYERSLGETPVRMENTTGRFALSLKRNVDYICLFWADNGVGYNAESLLAVAQSPGQASSVAYGARVVVNSNNFEESVVLKRAVTELSFIDEAGLTEASNTFRVTYPYASATLNLGTGYVLYSTGEWLVRTIEGITPPSDYSQPFAKEYILAPASATNVGDFLVQLNEFEEKTISDVKLQANYKTQVRGQFQEEQTPEPEPEPEDPVDESLFVEIAGVKWAVGNLVADAEAATGVKIGASQDGGLYFRWGSLIGWSGAVNNDGTGLVIAGSSNPALVVAKPAEFTTATEWGNATNTAGNPYITGIYTATDMTTKNLLIDGNGVITAAQVYNPALGIGDACHYYLGGKWRMPTAVEYNSLFNIPATSSGTNMWGPTVEEFGWSQSFIEDPKGLTYNNDGKTLFIPASGMRNRDTGLNSNLTNGFGWSASTVGLTLFSGGSHVRGASASHPAGAHPIRCVYGD